ncbi:MAG: hypothetical protein QOD38_1752, partial [Acidimicrobiaceae bacterium]
DGAGAALVAPDASIPWWCAPRFDSPPLLWSLLDPTGTRAEVADAMPLDRQQAPAGRTTTTTVETPCGRVEVRDALVDGALIRLLRCTDGPLDVVHRCALGGFDGAARTDCREQRLRAAPGCWRGIRIDADGVRDVNAASWLERLETAAADFRAGRHGLRLPHGHKDRVHDSIAVLRACTFEATGAVVAAVTTSLPEAPGHDRQFDYRYAWLRDTSLAASVAALLGRPDLARPALDFLTTRLGSRLFDAPVFTVDGADVPDEHDVLGVAGWRDSRPVRVGNAAKEQVQYDALGFVIEAASVYLQAGGSLDATLWRTVREVADRVCDEPPGETSGIWELRKPRPLLCADIGRWIALDRAIWIARGWRPTARRSRWVAARRACRESVLSELRPDGRLPQAYGGDPDELDASALLIVMLRMLDRRDPRARALVEVHLDRLEDWPWLYRYRPGADDGFSGVEGAFLPCSWWAVSALAAIGDVDRADHRADALCRALPRLLSEEVDPDSNGSLGNVPLVWSHMETARALYLTDVARMRRRWGFLGLQAWRIAQFVHAKGDVRRASRSAGGESRE